MQKRSVSKPETRNGGGQNLVESLAIMAKQGDRTAFDRLVNHFWEDMVRMTYYRTQSSMEAEDLAQEIFIKAFSSLKSLKNPASFKPWLYRIAVNKVNDFHRKQKLMRIFRPSAGDEAGGLPEEARDQTASALDRVMREEFWGQVKEFCNSLAPKEREVFTLRFMDQLTIAEIAGALGRSQSAVKTHLYRAVAKFQKKPSLLSAIRGAS